MFSRIDKVSLQLTVGCNMDCVYCQQPKDSHDVFGDLYGLKNFLKTLPLGDNLEVRFIGGEVSPYPAEIRRAVEVIKEIEQDIDVKVTFSLATNGTNPDNLIGLMDIIPGHQMTVSWDGLQNGTMRQSGFSDEYFKESIRKLAKYGINVVYCLTPASLPTVCESLDFLLENDGKSFAFYFVHEGDYSNREFLDTYRNQITRIGLMFIGDYHDLTRRWQYHNWNVLYHHSKTPGDTKCKNLGRVIHVDAYGDVYPCIYFGDHKAHKIGDIYHGFDAAAIGRFNEEFFRAPSCGGCDLTHCFECPASEYVHNGHLHNRFGNTCALRAIEKQVWRELFPRLKITMMDEKFFWYDDLKEESKFPGNVRLPVGNHVTPLQPVPSKKLDYVRGWFNEQGTGVF